jgi:hypothetical protein
MGGKQGCPWQQMSPSAIHGEHNAGEEADALEAAFGIHCLRHRDKKPAGSCDELEAHFG